MESKHFKDKELRCHCGCGVNNVSADLLKPLEALREWLGVPIHLNSAYRCKRHNDSLKHSSPTSSHLKGLAVDIRCTDDTQRFDIITAALPIGFTRIGVGKDFVHLDVDQEKRAPVIWGY